jgi:hypothetical protein
VAADQRLDVATPVVMVDGVDLGGDEQFAADLRRDLDRPVRPLFRRIRPRKARYEPAGEGTGRSIS